MHEFYTTYLIVGIVAVASLLRSPAHLERFWMLLYGNKLPNLTTALAIAWLVFTWPLWILRAKRF